MPSQKLHGKGI